MKEQYNDTQMSEEDLALVCRMAMLLENCHYIPTENLYLPDSNGFFCHVKDLCIDDFDWITSSVSMRFLNTAIPPKLAKMTGIKSKRDQSILNDSEEIGDEFGQHEELTTRIKRILDGYPEACILKELLQNADDAGASELHFIKDFRYHGTEHTFSDDWKELQGPALCVYNDSVFTEKDLQGIQNLGIGSKADDPTSTGQYGVGFNVVYHLTDVPSFITRDFKTGLDTLCVLDPTLKYIPCASPAKPGRKFQDATKTVGTRFTDIMSGYLNNSGIWKSSRGTLFRFPLRCNDASLLSRRKITCEELETLLNELKKEMAECLLFLNNVRKISISSVEKDDTLTQEFIVKAEASIELQERVRFNQLVHEVRQQTKKNSTYVCSMGRKEIMYQLKVDINNQCTQEWLIVVGLGFKHEERIPERVRRAYEEKRLALLPSSGVAFNLKNERLIKNQDGTKSAPTSLTFFKAYCFLPLPLETGLPVHINGHFALDHEARRNIWWPDGGASSDLKLEWNSCLIENVIVPTYISTIQYLKTALFPNVVIKKSWTQLDRFHEAFPCKTKLKAKVWEYMAKILYSQIAETGCPIFPIVQRDYQMLKMADEKDTVNDMQIKKEQETKKTDKPILQKELLEIRWVSILSGAFPAYFDEIKYQLKDDFVKQNYDGYYGQSYLELMRWASKQSEFLAGILKDLGMKLIESPMWLYTSMKNAGINVHTISPQAVLQFLKSYGSSDVDKCNVGKVNVHIKDTRFRSIDGVYYLLDYCLKDKKLNFTDFEHVPLLLTADERIREFTVTDNLFLISFPELLPASANRIVHLSQYELLAQFNVFQRFVAHLQIKDIADLILDNIPQKYVNGMVETWNLQMIDIPNIQWMKKFWCFLSENLACLEDEQRLKKMETETNESNVDSPVVILCSSIRKHLGEYCFLPVLENDEHKLYPFKDGKHVLKIIPNVDGPEQSALTLLNVPVVDERCLPSGKDGYYYAEHHTFEILKGLVATVESVTDTLDCLFFNRRSLHLDNDACQDMLDFFTKRLRILKKEEKCQNKLRSLPFYCGLDNNFIALPKGTIIVVPEDVPVDGLLKFSSKRNISFIRTNDISLTLLEYLGCILPSKAAFYIHYILPHFQLLSSTAIMLHLKYIKDIVLPEMNYYQDKNGQRDLKLMKVLLRDIAFLPTQSGRVARACEFYNPHKDIFKLENQLCESSELPPSPFNEPEWEDFLVKCGIKSDITPEIFVDFANRLQRLGASGLSPVVMANSRLLVKILFDESFDLLHDGDLVSKVQKIKFLTPHSIQQIYVTIAPEYENGSRLVCFHKSTMPTNALLVWSAMGIISEDLTNMMRKSDISIATKTLGLLENPPIHVVLKHTQIVCSILKDKLEELISGNAEVVEAVTTMMSRIYGYLQKNGNEESKQTLKATPFILIKDRKLFVLAEQVVLDISEYEEIPPYLCKASLYFGQYHTMFEMHGAAKSLTCSHLAKVLYKIRMKSKGSFLEPNERFSTEKAVQLLFSKLRLEEKVDLNVLTLYLPSKKGNLIRSDSLVFVDHKFLEERVGENMPDLDFFVGFKELKIEAHDPILEISRLPEKYRPHLLSKIVTEELDLNCKDWAIPSDYGKQLQKFLHSPEFKSGVCRLVRDELYNNDKRFGEKDELEILEKLQSVVVICVERLTTVMVYKNKALPNTSMQRSLFSAEEWDEKDCSKLCIYFRVVKDSNLTAWISHISIKLSSILNTYLGKPLKENKIHFPNVLKCIEDPSAIEIELDEQEIRKIDVGILSEILLFMPELGTEIPISLHHLLDNSCTYIESGKFVAYELFDPLIDEDDKCDADPVYLLAKVLQIISDHTKSCPSADEWSIRYMIDIGGENAVEAVASQIYNFFRNDITDGSVDVVDGAVVFRWKIDRIKSYIRDVLRNAFRRTHQEFKRALKRLLLQYHPDIHQDNKDYFEDLTVFIFFIKKRLEEGQSVDDSDIFENFNNGSYLPKSEFEETCNRRAATYVRRQWDYQSRGGGGGGTSFFRDFHVKGPQPGQARRWFRQAESDFHASSTDKNQPNAYNWACYKSHQSAEKAIKALLYQIDADQVDRTHSLAALSQRIDDVELCGLACNLEGITGNYFQMRYPDAVPGGHGMATPSDIYTSNQAEKAVEFAWKILQLVKRKIPNL